MTSTLSTLDRKLFPDGLKTSGQHPVLPEAIYPCEVFPRRVEGPTVWQPEDFQKSPDKWTHPFSTEEIEELGQAADAYIESAEPLTGISKVCARARDNPDTRTGSPSLLLAHTLPGSGSS